MAFGVVKFVISPVDAATQDSSGYHSRVESDRAERGSECCWLSQRGSNWLLTLSAQYASTRVSRTAARMEPP